MASTVALAGSGTCFVLCSDKDGDNSLFIQHQEVCVWYRNQIIYKHRNIDDSKKS